MFAAEYGHLAVIEALIERGADLETKDQVQLLRLHWLYDIVLYFLCWIFEAHLHCRMDLLREIPSI